MAPGIMCFGSRRVADTGTARSEEIEKGLRADRKRAAREVKMLLLGTFGSPSSCCCCSAAPPAARLVRPSMVR